MVNSKAHGASSAHGARSLTVRGLSYSLCLLAALLFAVAGGANAQQIFGSIQGTVTDPSGSAVNNAKVTITDTAKGTSFEVNTNEQGLYTKGQLIPDPYKVTIEAPGFQKIVSNDLMVQVDQATQFNANLQVGNVNQEVEVTAAAPLLQTDRADVSQTFTSQEISQLPSVGRNLQAFELLNPGTIRLPWQHASDEDPQGSVQTVVNGQLFDATGYYLDGTINQDPILGIIVVNPTFDSVNEVKQANQDYDAEFGYTSAGVMTYSTKSGTNQFHGDVFEYNYTNTPGFQDFGRNPFTQNTPLAPGAYTPTTHENQFGGSLGGKIIKDKLFYFADAQLTRDEIGGSVLTSVPTAQDRTGNFSDWLALGSQYQIFCPQNSTANPGKAVPGNILGTGYCGTLPGQPAGTFLSPQAQALANYWPVPNTSQSCGGCPYNNFTSSGVLAKDGNQWNTRIDYYVNDKNTIFGRYSYAQFTEQAPGAFGLEAGGQAFSNANYAGSSYAKNQSVAIGWTRTQSATLINEFRFGYMRYYVNDVPNGYGTSPAAQAGIPGLNLDKTYTSGMPYFEIDDPNGTTYLGYALGDAQCNCPLTQFERQYQFVDNISKIHGNHNFKFGADVRYALNLRVPSDNHRSGQLEFNNSFTGNVPCAAGTSGATCVATGSVTDGLAMATFFLGGVTSFQRYVSSSTNAQERQKRLFWYAQDEWHVTPKLTVTYGVRWEMVFPETVNGPLNGAELNLSNGLMDVYGYGLISDSGYQRMNWHNFAPRTSIAYQLTPKTVIRAGYGWSYSLGVFGNNFGHNVTQNPPVLLNQTLGQNQGSNGAGGCANSFCDVFTLAQGPPSGTTALASFQPSPNGTYKWTGVGVSAFTRPGILTMPTLYAYNFTVQLQFGRKISLSGGYVGNSGRHTLLGTDENFNINQEYFIPGTNAAGVPYASIQSTLLPFNGLLGPRYNYGWTSGQSYFCNCANSQYNSFQGFVTIRALAGWTVQGNTTYQVSKGDGWGGNESYTFLYDRPLGYGNNPNLPHFQMVVAQNYDIPFGHGRKYGANSNKFVDAVFGGWNLSGITSWYSGLPFMPGIDNYGPNVQPYTGPNNRPNVGTGQIYPGNQNRNLWFYGCPAQQCTTGPYLWPASNTFGNYPINTLVGPHFINQDFSIMKYFPLTERMKFGLRLDSTNFFNHTNLGQPNSDVQSPSAGQITSTAFGNAYQMRILQFSGTLSW
jgi:hypothetical protein